MPIYEYRCPKCSCRFEVLYVRFGEEGKAVCPTCGFAEPDRLLSRFHLRGPVSPEKFGEDDAGGAEDFAMGGVPEAGDEWGEESESEEGLGGASEEGEDELKDA